MPPGFCANGASLADTPISNTAAANAQRLGFISTTSLGSSHGRPIPTQPEFAKPAADSDYTRPDFLWVSPLRDSLSLTYRKDRELRGVLSRPSYPSASASAWRRRQACPGAGGDPATEPRVDVPSVGRHRRLLVMEKSGPTVPALRRARRPRIPAVRR